MQCLTKRKHIIPLTYNSQAEAISHTINMLGGAHKEIINPTIGLWHIFLLCLHLYMRDFLNHRDNKVITQEERDLNRKEPSLTPF